MAKLCHCKNRNFIDSPIASSVNEASDQTLVSANYIDLFKRKKKTLLKQYIYAKTYIHLFVDLEIMISREFGCKKVWYPISDIYALR